MGLETGTFVDDLVTSNPVGATDLKSQGDDHLRLIKSVLKNTFPNATRASRFEVAPAAKTGAYTILASDERALIRGDATTASFTITLPLGSSVFAGYTITVMKSDSTANTVTVDGNGAETINGALTKVLGTQYDAVMVMWEGTEWKILAESVGVGFLQNVVEDTTPQLGAQLDVNGFELGDGTNELLSFIEVASAINEITIKHNSIGLSPEVQATGDDTDIGLRLVPKGTGSVELGGPLDTNAQAINESEGGNVASASSTDIWSTTGNTVHITGATQIDDFGTAPRVGARRTVIFDGAPLVANSANLALPGGANLTMAAGDIMEVYADTTTQFDCILHRKDGTAVSGAGGMTFIATVTALNAASADFDGNLSSTFNQYVIIGTDINPVTDDVDFYIRTDSNGGVSYDSGVSDYGWSVDGFSASGNSVLDFADPADAQMVTNGIAVNNGLGNAAAEGSMIIVWISNPSGTTYEKMLSWQLSGNGINDGVNFMVNGSGMRRNAAAIDSVQFFMSSGNFDGVFRLYGITNS
jgi:hypothetical protein